MIFDTQLGNSSETHRIEAFSNALKSVGEKDIKPPHDESWFNDLYVITGHETKDMSVDENRFDDLFVTGHGPEDEVSIDESWLDDLDEAA